jgi:hypothetical protein
MAKPHKKCGCGASYSKKEWKALHYVGSQKTEDETHIYTLEMRNCPKCWSTIGVETSKPKEAT